MDTIPQDIPHGKHYTYVLMYPDGYSDSAKAGVVFYVGKGTGKRIYEHEPEARRGVKSYKCNVIRKIWADGKKVVKNILAYFATDEDACQYEIALIFFMDGLTNMTDGGDGIVGFVHSDETRQRIGNKNKGKSPWSKGKAIWTEEERQAISDRLKGHTVSEEGRRKISEAKRGRKQTPEVIEKGAAKRRGRKHSEEWKQNQSKALKGRVSPQTGRPLSESQRQALIRANTGRKITPETRRKMSESHKGQMPTNIEQLKEMTRQRAAQRRKATQLELPDIGETFL